MRLETVVLHPVLRNFSTQWQSNRHGNRRTNGPTQGMISRRACLLRNSPAIQFR
jgi:hypothetical protein